MISCLHSSDPVSNEGEMRSGPIWNNRIPFAIVFLSVSLFLGPTMGTNAYRLPSCVCVRGYKRACSQYVNGATEKERYGDKRAHTFVLVMRYTYCSRAIMLSAHRHGTARGDFMRPAHTYSIRVHYATSSILVESVVRHGVKEL